MKFYSFIIFVVIILSHTEAQDCKATIQLSSDIDNVEYFLNDNPAGQGRVITIKSDSGIVYLSAKESGKIWNPLTIRDSMYIYDCGEYKKNFVFTNRSYVETNPDDAKVFNNDSLLGVTPLFIMSTYERLKLSKEGYLETEVNSSTINSRIDLERTGAVDDRSFYEKSLFKILMGGILVLGGSTAYFKLKADNKYQEFLLTGDVTLLRDIERYDLISGITFGALQINFGLLLYYFLSE